MHATWHFRQSVDDTLHRLDQNYIRSALFREGGGGITDSQCFHRIPPSSFGKKRTSITFPSWIHLNSLCKDGIAYTLRLVLTVKVQYSLSGRQIIENLFGSK
jgi:hypothetical protein